MNIGDIGNVFNFNGMFGKVGDGMCRYGMNCRIAVKTSNGYKSYDVESRRLVNCDEFVFDMGEDLFFVVPTNEVEVGDIILVNNTPRCVVKVGEDAIKVVDYENCELKTIVPERHFFLKNAYFFGKIVSPFGFMFESEDEDEKGCGMKEFMKYKMMMSVFNNSATGNPTSGGGMNNPMMMMYFMNNGGMFEKMFDGMFSKKSKKKTAKKHVIVEDIDDDNDDIDDDDMSFAAYKKAKAAAKKAMKKAKAKTEEVEAEVEAEEDTNN
jgi:hypothetical protein